MDHFSPLYVAAAAASAKREKRVGGAATAGPSDRGGNDFLNCQWICLSAYINTLLPRRADRAVAYLTSLHASWMLKEPQVLVMHLGQLATNVLRGRRFQSVEHSSHFSYLYSFIFHYISEERTLENALKKEKERERLRFFKTVSFSFFFFFFFFLRVERKSRPLLQTDADAPLKDWRADRNRQEPFFFSLSQSGQKKKKKSEALVRRYGVRRSSVFAQPLWVKGCAHCVSSSLSTFLLLLLDS